MVDFGVQQLGLVGRWLLPLPEPIAAWGSIHRSGKAIEVSTWHFYTDDYRFARLLKDPGRLPLCRCAAEINVSTNLDMSLVEALWGIYRKRRAACAWQARGVGILVDLFVHPKFARYALLGVPLGWTSYITRGHAGNVDQTVGAYRQAVRHAQTRDITFVVYGGGVPHVQLAERYGWAMIPDRMSRVDWR